MISSAQRRLLLLTATFALSLLSCGREVTGPENGINYGRARFGAVSLDPQMPSLLASLEGAGDVVPFERVRVVLRRSDGTISVDTIVDFPVGADSISLSLLVPLPLDTPEEGLPLSLTMAYMNAAGDTVFRGGPVSVIAPPVGSSASQQPITIPIVYDGVGKDAARVAISPKTATRVSGTSSAFTATAFDGANAPIANTPIIFYTLDSSRASIPNAATGQVTWLASRGVARIVAALPNGLKADTAFVQVSLPASQLVVQSGNAQSAVVSTALPAPIVLRTLASDNVPVAGVIVTFAPTTGGGSLSALVDTSDVNGEVSTSWTLGAAVGAQSITATAVGLTGSPLTVTATATTGAPSQVAFSQSPTAGVAGIALAPPVLVQVRDAAGNVVTSFTGAVSVELPTGAGTTLNGTASVNAVGGVATFSDLSLDLVGSYNLIAVSGALARDTSEAIAIAPGSGARLEFVAQPVGAVAGAPFVPPVSVVAKDAKGNVATGFTGTVTLGLLNAGGATLGGAVSVAALNGVATFTNLTVDKVGASYTLSASSGALVADTSAVFGISASLPTNIVLISGGAQSGPAGVVLSSGIVVEVRDVFGNATPGVTVNFASVLGGGSASSPTVVTDVLGRAATNWTLGPSVGTQTLRASLSGFSATLDIGATATVGLPSQLAFTAAPVTQQVAGQAFNPNVVVEVRDAGGNVVTNYNGPVSLGLGTNPTGAPLLGTLVVNAVNGIATFPGMFLEKAGVGYTLQAFKDTLNTTSAGFDVIATSATVITPVAGDAQTALVGAVLPDSIAVRVTDVYGNKVAGVAVAISITAGAGSISPSSIPTNALGEARTAWTLGSTAGVQSITATIPGGANVAFTALATAGAVKNLAILSGNSQTVEVGAQAAPVIFAVTDDFGNPIAGATVNFTVLTGAGSLASASAITNGSGQATATWTMGTVAGAQSIQAEVIGGITVNALATAVAGPAFQFQFFFPTGDNVRAGIAGAPMNDTMYVRVRDQYGNPKIGHPTQWSVLAGFSAVANATVLTDVDGLARNTATFGTVLGTNFGTGVTTDGLGSTLLFEAQVSAAAAVSFEFTSQPTGPVAAGAAIAGGVVGGRDAFANIGASFDSVTIVVDSGPAGAVLSGTATFAGAGGTATISGLSLNRAGTYRLRAERAGITTAVSGSFEVIAGAGVSLTLVSGGAQTGVVGTALASPVVYRVTDGFGNPVSGATVSWSNPAGSGSTSSATSITNAAGDASITWTLGNLVGVMTLGTSIDGGIMAAISATATTGAASNFSIFSGNNQTGAAGTAFSDTLRVRLTDSFGNPIAGATTNWTALAGASSLGAATALTNANGVAFNTGVFGTTVGTSNAASVTAAGVGNTLVFDVTITTGAAQTLEFASSPIGGIAGGVIAGVVIAARDAFNNAGATFDSVTIVVDSGPAGAVLSGTTTRAAVAGSASFDNLSLDLAGTYKLRAQRGAITAGVSTAFVVTAGAATTLALDSGDNQSAAAGSGFALPLRVRVTDAFGNSVAGAKVAWSGIGVSVVADTSLSNAAGIAEVNATADAAVGLGSVTATLAVAPAQFVLFDLTINAGGASAIAAAVQPLDGTAGTDLNGFSVRANDAFGNLATTFVGPVTLSAQLTNGTPVSVIVQGDSVDAVGGIATFLTTRIDVAGTYRLIADFGVLGTLVLDSIVIAPAAPATIALVDGDAQIGSVTSTLALPLRVRVTDSFGNGISGISVNWGVQSGTAEFSDTVVVSDAAGLAATTVLLGSTAGTINIGAFAAGLSGSPVLFTATASAGAVTELVLTSGGGQNVVAGTTAGLPTVVQARDAFGNPVSGVSVSFNLLDGASAFSDTTVVTDASGFASTTAIGATLAGSRSFEAAASGVSSLNIPIEILAAAAQGFEVSLLSSTVTAGDILGAVTVQARDAFGNLATYTDSVALTIETAPPGGTLLGTTTVLAAGSATFSNLQLQVAGPYVLRASWPGIAAGLSAGITVSPAAPSAIASTFGDGQSGAVQSVLADSLRVRVTDVYGNGVSGVTVNWGTFSGDATPTVASSVSDANGLAATTVSLGTTPGAAVIQASAAGLTGSPVGFDVTVTAGAATQLVVDAQPTTGTAGVILGGVTVSARDALGNVVTVFTNSISVAVDSGPVSGALLGTSAIAPSAGVAAFTDLSVEIAGSYRLRFSALGVPDTLSALIVVAPSVPSAIALVSGNTQSDTVGFVLGTPLRVRVTDIFGNPITGQPVAWAAVGAGAVSQDTTLTNAIGEAVATFTLGTAAGSTTAQASVDGITGSPVLFSLNAIPGSVDTIVVTQQPTTTESAAVGTPINAEVRDVFGNVVTWFTADVQLFVQSGPGGLGLARTRAAVAGTVSFDDLTLNLAGSYTLRLAAVGAPDVLTNTLVIVAGAPASVVIASGDAQSGIVTLPLPLPLQVRVTDANSNPIIGDTVVFSITQGGGTLSSATALDSAITNSSGIAQTTWTLGSDSTITHIVQANRTGFATLSFTATPLPFVANRIWTGDVDSNVLNSGNWKDGLIPAATDSVLVPAGRPNYAVLTSNIQTARLTVASGATVELGPWVLGVFGSLSVLGTATITSSDTGAVALQGAGGGTVRGSFPRLVVTEGNYSSIGNISTATDLQLIGNGILSLGSTTANVARDLAVTGAARLVMTSGSEMVVERDVTFASTNQTTGLDNGTLRVRRNVSVNGSFSPSASHITDLDGPGTQTVQFTVPDSSFTTSCSAGCFGTLVSNKASGGLLFLSNVKATGSITVTGDTLGASGRTIIGVTGTTLQSAVTTAGNVGYTNSLQIGSTFLADTLVAFGGDGTTPLATVGTITSIVQGSYRLGTNHPGAVVVTGQLDIDGSDARIGGNLITANAGHLRMTDTNDSLSVAGAQFGGTTDSSFLTAGVLDVRGTFTQNGVGVTTYAALSGHRLRVSTNNPIIQMDEPALNPIGSLALTDQSSLLINGTGVRINGTAVLEGVSAATSTTAEAVILGGLVDSVGNRWTLPVTRFVGNGVSQIPRRMFRDVVFEGAFTLTDSLIVGGGTYVSTANGVLTMAGHPIQTDSFATETGGTLVQTLAADSLLATGNVYFNGGASQLTDGYIAIGGSFTQTDNGNSFSAGPNHVVAFVGNVLPPTITLANAGNGAGTTQFGTLRMARADGTTLALASDVFAASFESTLGNSYVIASSGGSRLVVGSTSASNLTFVNIRWDINGTVPASIPNITFGAMDPTATQLSVEAQSGTVSFPGLSFATTPTSGLYIYAQDNATADNDTLTVDVAGVSPAFHGGKILPFTGSKIINWDAFAAINWTNGALDQNWFNLANWAEGVVPGAADSVIVGETGLPPVISGSPVQVRALVSTNSQAISTNDTLTVTRRLTVSSVGGLICAPGGALVLRSSADSVTVQGNIDCLMIARENRVRLTNLTLVDSLSIENSGSVAVDQWTLNVAGELRTIGTGGLLMDQPSGYVEIGGTASFLSDAPDGWLTNGTLSLLGDFIQVGNPTAFRASGAHTTLFAGGSDQAVFFTNPDSSAAGSHFANVEIANDEGGISVALASDVFMNGELRANTGLARTFSNAVVGGATIVSRGAIVNADLDLDGVRWKIREGSGLTGTLSNVRFTNQPEGITQLSVARDGGSIQLSGFQFDSLPASTTYLEVLDSFAGGGGTFTVDMLSPSPAFHGGRVSVDINALLTNWAQEPGFIWTGALDATWTTPGNWSDNVVPNATSVVTIPDVGTSPATVSAVTVRQLVLTGNLTGLQLGDTLFVREGLQTQAAAVSCVALGRVRFVPTDTALVEGNINCPVDVMSGVMAQSGNTNLSGALLADSVGRVAVREFDLFLAPGSSFNTTASGTLSMDDAAGSLTVNGPATFAGGATTGLLTAGQLVFGGDVTQGSGDPAALDASSTLGTIFSGASGTVSIADPASSGFGTSDVVAGTFTITGTAPFRATLNIGVGGTLNGAGRIDVTGDISGDGGLVVTTAALTGSFLRNGPSQPDSVIFIGTGQTINSTFAANPIAWNTVIVEGTATAATSGAANDVLNLAQSLIVRGAGARLTFDNTGAPGDSLIAYINNQIRTLDGGTVEMNEAGVSVRVGGFSEFAGGDQNGLLTQGRLILQAGLKDTVFNAFAATGAHLTVIGGCGICDGIPVQNTEAASLRFASVRFVNGASSTIGASFVTDTAAFDGGVVSMTGLGKSMLVNGDLSGLGSSTLNATRVAVGGVFGFDGTFNIDSLAMTGVNQRLPAKDGDGDEIPYQNVDITGTVQTLMADGDSLTVSGGLRVASTGNLRFGESGVTSIVRIANSLVTNGTGTIEILDQTTTVRVLGTAIFSGGSTAGLLDAGTFEFHSDFTQTGTSSTSAFSAGGTNLSRFVAGAVPPVINFANAGGSGTESHFGHWELSDGAGTIARLATDVYATGQIIKTGITPIVELGSTDVPKRIYVTGANISSLTFRSVSMQMDGSGSPLTTLSNLSFVDQDPVTSQLVIIRDGSDGVVQLENPIFSTPPTTGRYLSLQDNVVDANFLTVNVVNPFPGFHAGFAETLGGSILTGWPTNEPALYTFTGAVDTVFTNLANWDVPYLPTSTSNVRVDNTLSGNALVLSLPVTFKTLTTAVGSLLTLRDTVYTTGVLGGFDLVDGTTTCSGNGILAFNDPSPGPTFLRANLANCDVVVLQGNVNVSADIANVRDVRLEGGFFGTFEGVIRIAGDLTMTGSSMIYMQSPLDSLIVLGDATFRGQQANLSAGNLVVHGNIDVGAGPELQFRMADSSHLSLGNPNQSGGTHNISIDPGSQMYVDSLTIYDGSTTVTGQLNVHRRLRQVRSNSNVILGDAIELGDLVGQVRGTLRADAGSQITVNRFQIFGGIDSTSSGDFSPDTTDFVGTVNADNGGVQRIRAASIVDTIYQYKLVRVFENAVMNQIPTGIPIAYTIATGLQVLGGQLTIGNVIDTVYVNMPGADLIVSGPLAGFSMAGLSLITVDSAHFQGGITSQLSEGRLVARSVVAAQEGAQNITLNAADPHVLDIYGTGWLSMNDYANNPLNTVRLTGGAVTTLNTYLRIDGSLGRVSDAGLVTLRAGSIPGFPQFIVTPSTNFSPSNSGLLLRSVALSLQATYPEPGGNAILNNVTFTDMDPTSIFLQALWGGAGSATATWNNINFNSPVSTGRYFEFATGGAGSAITFVNASPAAGCLASTCFPADVSPSIEAGATWTGASSSSWTDAANWSTSTVPTADADVIIPSLTPFAPVISANTGVKSLTVDAGATLGLNTTEVLSVFGDLTVNGTVTGGGFAATIRVVPPLDTAEIRAPGDIQTRLQIGAGVGAYDGVAKLMDRVNLTTANFNSGVYLLAGLLDLNGQTLSDSGSFRNFGTSRWKMTNPLDTLIVGENFDITGGSTEGLLTEGEIDVSGTLFRQQSDNSQKSFVSTGNHSVRFSGGDFGMDVVFESPDSTLSRIANLAIDRIFNQWVYLDYSRVFVTNLTKVSGKIELYNDGFGVNLGSDGELIVSGTVSNVDPSHMFDMILIGKVKLLGVDPATCDGLTFNVQYQIANFEPLSCHSSVYAWATETGTAAVTSYGAYAASDNDLWVVGANGTIQRGNGTSWTTETSNTDSTLFAVHGTSTTDVWAVGASGTVAHWDGSIWTSSTQGAQNLNGVFATNINLAYAVGDNGTILRWDGSSWSSMTSGTSVNLRGIYGAGLVVDDILAVGDNGTMLRLVSGSWVPITSVVSDNFKATYASTPSGYMVFGENGTIRQRGNPYNQFFDAGSPTIENLNGAGGNGTAGFTVGANGTILRILGESFLPQNALTSVELYGVTVTPNGTAYVVGAGGFITKGTIVP